MNEMLLLFLPHALEKREINLSEDIFQHSKINLLVH
jgi:hypothetical protein